MCLYPAGRASIQHYSTTTSCKEGDYWGRKHLLRSGSAKNEGGGGHELRVIPLDLNSSQPAAQQQCNTRETHLSAPRPRVPRSSSVQLTEF